MPITESFLDVISFDPRWYEETPVYVCISKGTRRDEELRHREQNRLCNEVAVVTVHALRRGERPLTRHRQIRWRKALPRRRSTSFFRRNRRYYPRLALSADKVGIRAALTSAQTRANDVESEKWERERKKNGERNIDRRTISSAVVSITGQLFLPLSSSLTYLLYRTADIFSFFSLFPRFTVFLFLSSSFLSKQAPRLIHEIIPIGL